MKLNLTKEEHIVHAKSNRARKKPGGVVVDGREEAMDVKLLGITVNRNYKFTKHVSKVISATNYRLSHMAKLSSYIPDEQLKQATQALALSVLNWGAELAARDQASIRRLQRTQNVALRIMTRSSRRKSVRIMLQQTKLLNMENQARMQQMSLLRRVIVNDICPVTLGYIVMPQGRTRNKDMRCTLPITHKHGPRSMVVRATKLLNAAGWTKESGKAKEAFKKLAMDYILRSFTNKNTK